MVAGNQDTWDSRLAHRVTSWEPVSRDGAAGKCSRFGLSSALGLVTGLLSPARGVGVGDAAATPQNLRVVHGLVPAAQHPPLWPGTALLLPRDGRWGSCHPPCPRCWWQRPGAAQVTTGTDRGPSQCWSPPFHQTPCAAVQGQPRTGTGDSHLYISLSGSESQRSGNLSVLPAPAKPNRAPTAAAPACSAPRPLVCVGTGQQMKPI